MKTNFPLAAFVAIVLIIAIEAAFFSNEDSLTMLPIFQPTADDGMVSAKMKLLNHYLESDEEDFSGREVAIFGDSSSLHGLMPSVMNQEGLRYINFATLASMTSAGFVGMAVKAISCDNPPDAVVLALLPQTVALTEQRARDMGQIGRVIIAYGLQEGQSYPLQLKDYTGWFVKKHRFNVFPPEFGGSFENLYRELSENDGFYVEKNNNIKHSNKIKDVRVSPMSSKAIDFLIETAKTKNIPVVFIFNPKPAALVNRDAYLKETSNFLKQQSQSGFIVIQQEAPLLDLDSFATETHLAHAAAKVYSKNIADKIVSANIFKD